MFLFIFPFVIFAPVDTLLSIHLMFLFILFLELLLFLMGYFNTSHVLIYPCTWRKWNGNENFQYISCSYLSKEPGSFLKQVEGFQYISCSYLSLIYVGDFNMSTGFQYISCSYLSLKALPLCTSKVISIHLMFLFISCTFYLQRI